MSDSDSSDDALNELFLRLAGMIKDEMERSLPAIEKMLEKHHAAIIKVRDEVEPSFQEIRPLLDEQRIAIIKAVEQSLAGAAAGSGAASGDEIARLRRQIVDQYRDFTALLRQPARTPPASMGMRQLALTGAAGAVLLVVLLHILPAGLAGMLAGVTPDRTGGLGALMVDRAGPMFEKCLGDARAAGRAVPCNIPVAP